MIIVFIFIYRSQLHVRLHHNEQKNHPRNIIDVRTISSADVGMGLVLVKINLLVKPRKANNGKIEKRLNTEETKRQETYITD